MIWIFSEICEFSDNSFYFGSSMQTTESSRIVVVGNTVVNKFVKFCSPPSIPTRTCFFYLFLLLALAYDVKISNRFRYTVESD
jgi:hypothetical protein